MGNDKKWERERMHPCIDCGELCSYNAIRCRNCSFVFNKTKRWANITKYPKEHFREYHRRKEGEYRYKKTCPICGDFIDRHAKLCRKCKDEFYSGSNSPNWRGGTVPYTSKEWRKARTLARKKARGHCQNCGKTEAENGRKLDTHHKTNMRSYLFIDVSHNLKNLICLCRKCHAQIHHPKGLQF